jgi:uncharacterized protein YqeY
MLIEQIENDYKTAFKANDDIAKSSLSNVRAGNKKCGIRKTIPDLTDAEVMAVLQRKLNSTKIQFQNLKKASDRIW